ncbi:MAG: N-acyl homoserine lactonase family protein, partial [Beijerinckiaceae bacterium]
EPRVTGNHGMSKRAEKAAIKRLMNMGAFLLPVHDKPAKVHAGYVTGRMDMAIPGPMTQSLPTRNWFPM